MSSKIPQELINKIREKYPKMESLIDETQADFFTKDGVFDEILFRKYIVEKRRAEIINEILRKGGPLPGSEERDKFSDKGRARRVGRVLHYEGGELINLERQVAQVVLDYTLERTENTIRGTKKLLHDSLDSLNRELDISLNSSSAQMDAAGRRVIDKYRMYETDPTKIENFSVLLRSQFDKLKIEDSRSSKKIKGILKDKITPILEKKISELSRNKNFSYDDIELTEQEEQTLVEEVSCAIRESVENQRKLRTEIINEILGRVIGIDNPIGLIEFIKGSKYVTDEQKERFEELISAGFLTNQTVIAGLGLGDENLSDVRWLINLEKQINEKIQEKRAKEHPIYDGWIWTICNGGFWAPLAHAASYGFCTGFTLGVGIGEAILLGDWYRLLALLIVVVMILAINFLAPAFIGFISSKFVSRPLITTITKITNIATKYVFPEIQDYATKESRKVIPFENFRGTQKG